MIGHARARPACGHLLRFRRRMLHGRSVVISSTSPDCSALSTCGLRTRPIGWMVAPCLSTSTVTSLAEAAAVVTTATRRATSGSSAVGSPKYSTGGAPGTSSALPCPPGGNGSRRGILGHLDRSGPGPRLLRGTRGTAEVGRRFPEHREHRTGPQCHEPGLLLVVAYEKGDRHERVERFDGVEPGVLDVPGHPFVTRDEPFGWVAIWFGQPKGDPLGTHGDSANLGRCRTVFESVAEKDVGRLERGQRRDAGETVHKSLGVDCFFREQRAQVQLSGVAIALAVPPCASRDRSAAQRTEAEGQQFGEVAPNRVFRVPR